MAVAGELINRASTPMKLLEENYDESREAAKLKRVIMEEGQSVRSPFLIGSIEEINQRISKLDQKLQSYHELVVESRVSDAEDLKMMMRPPSAKGREVYQKREKEAREVNQFAGIYAIKSTFTPGVSDRVKNISKISMEPNKVTNNAPSQKKTESSGGKPKFVELHQFPGYDSNELTPLPNDTSAVSILSKVANAQPLLRKKPGYRPEFERLFYSQMSQALLQDTFWWYFLERYQASKHYQAKLFNRVAHNYVKLLTYAKQPQYRDAFLKDFPSLLAQSVYAAFCAAFPDSYRQFNANFKEDLVNLVYDWVAGVRPAPRTWLHWNMSRLEPQGIKIREEMMNRDNSKTSGKSSSLINFDFLESAVSQMTGSQSTLNPAGSVSSLSSVTGRRPQITSRKSHQQSNSVLSSESKHILSVAEAQEIERDEKNKVKRSRSKMTDLRQETQDALTPIHEFEENSLPDDENVSPDPKTSKSYMSMVQSQKRKVRQSHPIGRGPDFVRGVFNIFGTSPLVAHFMRMKNVQSEAGLKIRIQRTEMENMPPLDAPTYKDLIKKSFQHVKDFDANYRKMVERSLRNNANFVHDQRVSRKEFMRQEVALLSKPREVKRLADLLMLELKRDHDSIGTGATAAVEAALMAQEPQ